MTPRIQTGLVESAAPAADNDAPKAGTVLVVGSAGKGPTAPTFITQANDAYRLFGSEGRLASTIELVLQGTAIGSQLAGTGVFGRVVALRTETGELASITLNDAQSRPVMRLTALQASELANQFGVSPLNNGINQGYSIYDPTTDSTTDIAVNFSGIPNASIPSTPSAIANVINNRFSDVLSAEVFLGEGRFEIVASSLTTDDDSDVLITASTSSRTSLDLSGLALADAQALRINNQLFLDYPGENSIPSEFYRNALSETENEDARFYSITAGKPLAIPKGAERVRIPNLANSAAVGQSELRSLINVRTTGIGAVAEVDFLDATKRGINPVSEGYMRVRDMTVGRFQPTPATTTYTWDVMAEPAYRLTFEAPHGIADDGGVISTDYAATQTTMTADQASSDRLGEQLVGTLLLKSRPLSSNTLTNIPLRWTLLGLESVGVLAAVTWDDTTGDATLFLNKADFDTLEGSLHDEGEMFVSFDSCVFDLQERRWPSINPATEQLQYAINDQGEVIFNRALEHELVIRPLRITQYRLGDSLFVDRSETGNVFNFVGRNQPGEGGGPMSATKMTTMFGFDYKYEPNFPVVPLSGEGPTRFAGGTSGANATADVKISALNKALAEYKDVEYKILLVSDLYVDDTVRSYDEVTGSPKEASVDLLGTLRQHQARLNATGASGVVYASVKPMKPTSSNGKYTDAQKARRVEELSVPSAAHPTRAATIIDAAGRIDDFFLFDAPVRVAANGRVIVSDGAALFAGVRVALPNDHALYQKDLPAGIVTPLYRYDVPDFYMPGILSEARINTWDERRGEVRLADEKTAAQTTVDVRGNRVPSNFTSGVAMLVSKEFLQRAVSRLRNMLGPIPRGGVDVLRGTVVTELRNISTSVVGIQGIDIDENQSIQIRTTGGNTLAMVVTPQLLINGELRSITINVKTTNQLVAAQQSVSTSSIGLAA